jgi:Glycosyl transferase family 2
MIGHEVEGAARVEDVRSATFDPSTWRLLLFGVLVLIAGLGLYVVASCIATVLIVFGHGGLMRVFAPYLLLPGVVAFVVGAILVAVDLFVLLPSKRQKRLVAFDDLPDKHVTAVLTAWNDELSITQAIRDFSAHPMVRRVIVVDNASTDRTQELATDAGAIVISEVRHGYGRCVYRALQEGAAQTDTGLTLLCEGDATFRAFDIDKFLAYIPHAEIVNGTRIVEQLRARSTQLTTFIYYGNFVVGKLLEAKYLGQGTLTDVGTTYKLCRNSALRKLLPRLNPDIDLEFNAHFLDMALRQRISLVECPITFHARIGQSKGGNRDNARALGVGLRMIAGMLFGWR